MKNFKYIIGIISAVLLITGCKEEQTVEPKPEVEVSFKQASYELTVGGETLDLAAELIIENSDSKPGFASSDAAIASVSEDGVVTPESAGQTKVTVTVDGKEAVCTIVVKEPLQLTLTADASLVVGVSSIVTASCSDENFDPSDLEWEITMSPAGVAEFKMINDWSYSFICPEYKSNASVTVSIKDKFSNASATTTMQVVSEVKRIVLNHTSLTKQVGDEPVQLVATCYDENNAVVEGYNSLEWSVRKDEFTVVEPVEVDQNGVLTFKEYGTATVTVVNTHNKAVAATCIVNVSPPDVVVESIVLSHVNEVIKVGEKFTISAHIEPDDADDKTLTFVSSDDEIASVTQSGEVEGLSEGNVDITVSASNGVSAVCKVQVSEDETGGDIGETIPVEEVMMETQTKENVIYQLEPLQMIAYYMPTGSAPKSAVWSTSDETLATIDQNGLVTVVTEEVDEVNGTYVEIRLTVDEKIKSYLTLEIKRARPTSVRITSEPENKQIVIGDSFHYTAVVEPALADQAVVWQCFDPSGESILNGISFYTGEFNTGGVSPIKEIGTYTIRAKSSVNNSIIDETTVEVLPVKIESASLNYEEVTLPVGGYVDLFVSFEPHNVTFKDVVWASSDTAVAVVTDGKVTAVAVGESDVTATLSDGTVLTCNVKVEAAKAQIGDFFYSDGTWSTKLDASKTVVGIVFSVDNVTLHDKTLAEEHPGCTNGIVVSLKETAPVRWQNWRSDVDAWATSHGYMHVRGVNYANNQFSPTEDGRKLSGYNNTAALKAYMQSPEYAEEGEGATVYLLDNEADMTDVEGTSGWYIPSYAEMSKLADNSAVVLERIQQAGGEAFAASHWSSTEGAQTTMAVQCDLNNKKYTYNASKDKAHNVRYVFAF